MAQQFNLTAQLQLQAPTNANQVINQIRRQLKPIGVSVNIQNAKNLSQANKSLQSLNKNAQASKKSVNDLNRTLQESARRFSVITLATGSLLALANGFKNAVKGAVEFEREVIKISQVTGRSLSGLQGLTKEVTRLSTSLGASSSDLLAVSKTLSQAGFAATDTKRALDILAKTTLGSTFDNVQQTTEGAIALLRQFTAEAQRSGGNIKFLEKSIDAVNSVSKNFAVESGDLITAIRRVGGVFSAAGGSVNELIALFTSVRATTRESAETIATGLRTIFTRIQRAETIDQLRSLNIELADSQGNFVGAFKAVERLSKGLAGLDPRSGTFSQIVEELGGFRQVGKVIPLIQQFATAQQALNVAQGASGSVTRDAILAQKGLGVQVAKVREQFDALIRKFSDSSTFNTIATGALRLAEAFIKIADSLERLLPLIAGLAFAKLGRGLAPALGGVLGVGRRGGSAGNVSKFARGGLVPGSGNRDTVPAMLTPGEFVIKKSSVNSLGAGTLAAMNQNRYAAGGIASLGNKPARTRFINENKKIVGVGQDRYSMPDTKDIAVEISKQSYQQLRGGGRGWEEWLAKKSFEKNRPKGLPARLKINRQSGYPIDFNSPNGRIYDAKDLTEGSISDIEKAKKSLNYSFIKALGPIWNWAGRPKSSPMQYGDQGFGTSNKKLTVGEDRIDLQPLTLLYPKIVDKKGQTKNLKEEQKLRTARNKAKEEKKMATGGGVSGSDTVPALLTPGEFVFSKSSAQSIGYSNLNRMNKHGVRGYASGGIVQGFNEGGRAASAIGRVQGAADATQSLIFLAGSASAVATQFLGLKDAQAKTVTEIIGFYTILGGAVGTIVDVLSSFALLFVANKAAQGSEMKEVAANEASAASELAKVRANKISTTSDVAGSATGSAVGGAAATGGGGFFGRFKGFFKGLTKAKVGFLGLATAITAIGGTFVYFDFLKTRLKNLADAAGEAANKIDEDFKAGKSATSGRSNRLEQFRKMQETETQATVGNIKLINSVFRTVGAGIGAFAGAGAAGLAGSIVPGAGTAAGAVVGGTIGGVAGERAGANFADLLGFGDGAIRQLESARNKAISDEIDAANRLYDAFENTISASQKLSQGFEGIERQGLTGSSRTSARISVLEDSGVLGSVLNESTIASEEAIRLIGKSGGRTQEDITSGKSELNDAQVENFNFALTRLTESIETAAQNTKIAIDNLQSARDEAFKSGEFLGAGGIRDIFDGTVKPTTDYERAVRQAALATVVETKAKNAKINLDILESKAQSDALQKQIAAGDATDITRMRLEAYQQQTESLTGQLEYNKRALADLGVNLVNAESVIIAENQARQRSLVAQQQYAQQTMQTARVMQSFKEELLDLDLQGQLLDNLKTVRSGGLVRGNVVKLTESDISKISNPARFASEIAKIVASAQDPRVTSAGKEILQVVQTLRSAEPRLLGASFTGTTKEADAKAVLRELGIDRLISPEQLNSLVDEIIKVAADEIDADEFSQLFGELFKNTQAKLDGIIGASVEKSEKFLDNYNKFLSSLIEKQNKEIAARSTFVDALNKFDDIRSRLTQQVARDRGVDIAPNIGMVKAIREEAQARSDLRTRGLDPRFAGNAQALGSARQFLEGRRDELAQRLTQQRSREEQRNVAEELAKTKRRLDGVNQELERLRTSTTKIDALFNAMDINSQLIDKERSKRETLLGVLEEAVTGGIEGRQNLYRDQSMATRAIQMGTLQGFAPDDQKQIVTFLRSLGDEIPVAFGKSGKKLADELIARDIFKDPFISPIFKQALANTISSEEKLIQSNLNLAAKIDGLAGVMLQAANPQIVGGFSKGGPVYRAEGGSIGSIFKPKGTDTIPAMLSEGEYVLRKSAVDQYGTKALDNMNKGKGFVSGSRMSGGGGNGESVAQNFQGGGLTQNLKKYLMSTGMKEQDADELVSAIQSMSRPQLTRNLFSTGVGGLQDLLSRKNAQAYYRSDQYRFDRAADTLQQEIANTLGFVDATGITGALNAAVLSARGLAGRRSGLNVDQDENLTNQAAMQASLAALGPDFFYSSSQTGMRLGQGIRGGGNFRGFDTFPKDRSFQLTSSKRSPAPLPPDGRWRGNFPRLSPTVLPKPKPKAPPLTPQRSFLGEGVDPRWMGSPDAKIIREGVGFDVNKAGMLVDPATKIRISAEAAIERSLAPGASPELLDSAVSNFVGRGSRIPQGLTGNFALSETEMTRLLAAGGEIPEAMAKQDPVMRAVKNFMSRATKSVSVTDEALMAKVIEVARKAIKANPNSSRVGKVLMNSLEGAKEIPPFLMGFAKDTYKFSAEGASSIYGKTAPLIARYFPSLYRPVGNSLLRIDELYSGGYGQTATGLEDPIYANVLSLMERAFDEGKVLQNIDDNIRSFESIASLQGEDGPIVPELAKYMQQAREIAEQRYAQLKEGIKDPTRIGDQTGFLKNYDFFSNYQQAGAPQLGQEAIRNISDADSDVRLIDGLSSMYLSRMLQKDTVEGSLAEVLKEAELGKATLGIRELAKTKKEQELIEEFSDDQIDTEGTRASNRYLTYRAKILGAARNGVYEGAYISDMYPTPFMLQGYKNLQYPQFSISGRGVQDRSDKEILEFFKEQSKAAGGNHKILNKQDDIDNAVKESEDFMLGKSVDVLSRSFNARQLEILRFKAKTSKRGEDVLDKMYQRYFNEGIDGRDSVAGDFDSATSAFSRWDSRLPLAVYNGMSGNFQNRDYNFNLMDQGGRNLTRPFALWTTAMKGVGKERWENLAINKNNQNPLFFNFPIYRAHGGKIPMYMSTGGGVDDVPAMLTAGEYVMRKEAVNRLGVGYLDKLNQGVEVPGFANGGEVSRRDQIAAHRKKIRDDRQEAFKRFQQQRNQPVANNQIQVGQRGFGNNQPQVNQQQGNAAQGAIAAIGQNIQNLIGISRDLMNVFGANGPLQLALLGITKNHQEILTISQGMSKAAMTLSKSTGNLATAIKEGIKVEMEDVNVSVGGNITLDQNVISGLSEAIGNMIIGEAAPVIIQAAITAIRESGGG